MAYRPRAAAPHLGHGACRDQGSMSRRPSIPASREPAPTSPASAWRSPPPGVANHDLDLRPSRSARTSNDESEERGMRVRDRVRACLATGDQHLVDLVLAQHRRAAATGQPRAASEAREAGWRAGSQGESLARRCELEREQGQVVTKARPHVERVEHGVGTAPRARAGRRRGNCEARPAPGPAAARDPRRDRRCRAARSTRDRASRAPPLGG